MEEMLHNQGFRDYGFFLGNLGLRVVQDFIHQTWPNIMITK